MLILRLLEVSLTCYVHMWILYLGCGFGNNRNTRWRFQPRLT
jgi:hypothetical protein